MEYENKNINDDEYLKPYEEYTRKGECKSACKKRAALKNAFATRNFEIELYWKRTAYFWVFISAIFIAYYHVVTSHDLCASKKETFPLLLAALGVSLCLAVGFASTKVQNTGKRTGKSTSHY